MLECNRLFLCVSFRFSAIVVGLTPRALTPSRSTTPKLRLMAAKLKVLNPLIGGCAYMGRHTAERKQKAGKLTISPCGTTVTFIETSQDRVNRHNATVRLLRQQVGYDQSSATGLIAKEEMRNIPLIGPDAWIKIITKP